MKKINILLAIIALAMASLACQTVMGGGDSNNELPNAPVVPGGDPVAPTVPSEPSYGGESPFSVTDDAFNVISTPQSVTYQTKLSADEVMQFYRDDLGKQGYTENSNLTTNFGGIIAMFFEGNGKTIVLGGAPAGDGSLTVTLAYQQ